MTTTMVGLPSQAPLIEVQIVQEKDAIGWLRRLDMPDKVTKTAVEFSIDCSLAARFGASFGYACRLKLRLSQEGALHFQSEGPFLFLMHTTSQVLLSSIRTQYRLRAILLFGFPLLESTDKSNSKM
jgi:hypothetical protein